MSIEVPLTKEKIVDINTPWLNEHPGWSEYSSNHATMGVLPQNIHVTTLMELVHDLPDVLEPEKIDLSFFDDVGLGDRVFYELEVDEALPRGYYSANARVRCDSKPVAWGSIFLKPVEAVE